MSRKVTKEGTIYYSMENGNLHRLDGPAVIYPEGEETWYQNGKLHRLDGPAMVLSDGLEWWYQNGKRHREDGPAVVVPDGLLEWWHIDGKRVPCPEK